MLGFGVHLSPTRISNFRNQISMMTQSSDDGEQRFGPPSTAEQFSPLQSVFRRRLLNGIGAASLLAAGANFGGLTSFVLGFSPETARSLKLDALYPVGGCSRYIDETLGFEFMYPENWLGDQTLLNRAADRAKKSLDPPPLSSTKRPQRNIIEPVIAFGPPSSNGELNVSVIVSQVPIDFSIEAFGGTEEVGEAIVRNVTGRRSTTDVKGKLISSVMREDMEKMVKYYEIEFGMESPSFKRHNLAVCCARKGRLFTLNAQTPESVWLQMKSCLYTVADSFCLI